MGGQCTEIDIMPVSLANPIHTHCSGLELRVKSHHPFFYDYLFSFPLQNATIAEYGTYSYLLDRSDIVHKLQSEIYARGPVATGVNAEPLVEYTGGRVDDTKIWHMMVNHIVSIVGWETDPESGNVYWIVRNSWGK